MIIKSHSAACKPASPPPFLTKLACIDELDIFFCKILGTYKNRITCLEKNSRKTCLLSQHGCCHLLRPFHRSPQLSTLLNNFNVINVNTLESVFCRVAPFPILETTETPVSKKGKNATKNENVNFQVCL